MEKVQQSHDHTSDAEYSQTHPDNARKEEREERSRLILPDQFAQGQSKLFDHETKSDRCQSSPYPCQKGALVGQVVRHLGAAEDLLLLLSSVCLRITG